MDWDTHREGGARKQGQARYRGSPGLIQLLRAHGTITVLVARLVEQCAAADLHRSQREVLPRLGQHSLGRRGSSRARIEARIEARVEGLGLVLEVLCFGLEQVQQVVEFFVPTGSLPLHHEALPVIQVDQALLLEVDQLLELIEHDIRPEDHQDLRHLDRTARVGVARHEEVLGLEKPSLP